MEAELWGETDNAWHRALRRQAVGFIALGYLAVARPFARAERLARDVLASLERRLTLARGAQSDHLRAAAAARFRPSRSLARGKRFGSLRAAFVGALRRGHHFAWWRAFAAVVPSHAPRMGGRGGGDPPVSGVGGIQIRVYAMAIFLSAALLCTVYDAHFNKLPKRWSRASYVAVGVLCMYTQYYLGVLFVGVGAALAARRDARRLGAFLLDTGLIGALSVPLFFAAHAQIDSHANDLGPQLAMGESGLHVLVTRFENLMFSWNQTIDEGRLEPRASARGALVLSRAHRATAAGLVFRSRTNIAWRRFFTSRALWIVVFAYALCMLVLFRVAGPWAVGARHVAGLFVPVTLALLSFPALALSRGALRGWGIFLIATNAVSVLMMQVMPLAKDCDCRRVAAALTSLAANGEPILVFPSEDAMPLSLYYPGPNRLLPIPRASEHRALGPAVLRDREPRRHCWGPRSRGAGPGDALGAHQ